MVDFTSPNLQGANAAFNNIVSKLNDTKSSALSNLQSDASAASSALSSQLTNVNTELRSLVPEPVDIPNVNLQSQLQSLSGLTNPLQSANLLADIALSFGDALTTSGFDLDSLVSSAASVFGTDTSLSSLIPNFEVLPSGDVIQKASASLLPSIGPVTEEAATFVSNTNFTAAKTAAASAVYPTLEEAPTSDTSVFKVETKSKKITQTHGGVAITKEVTTVSQSVKVTESGGESIVTRSNYSPKGKVNRTIPLKEYFSWNEIGRGTVITGGQDQGDKLELALVGQPAKIKSVKAYTQERVKVGVNNRGKIRKRAQFNLYAKGSNKRETYETDTWELNQTTDEAGNITTNIIINQDLRVYDRETRSLPAKDTYAIIVRYDIHDEYDPTYKITSVST